jgi:membrane-associated protease RseP (regulator of RpoE activity)
MDMVGRLKPERTLAINGTGTSPFWEKNIKKINKKLPQSFELVLSQSGVGPSDHTSFYNIGIPAIHFFTGQHGEYHKPTDTENLINYDGLISITQYIEKIIIKASQESKLSFTPTKDESKQTASNFKVTLGVMPDYLYNGIGLKIDGAKEGRPGAKAGLKQGDIILKMGKYEINDIYGYMDALGKFNPGEKTDIEIKRGDQKLKLDVTFE